MGSGGEGAAGDGTEAEASYLVADPVRVKASVAEAPESRYRYSLSGREPGRSEYFRYSKDAIKASGRCLRAVQVIAEVSSKCGAGWKTREELIELDRPEGELLGEWQRLMEEDILKPLSALACGSGALFLKLGQMCAMKLVMAPERTRAQTTKRVSRRRRTPWSPSILISV